MKYQRGQLHLTSQFFAWLVNLVIAISGGVFGGAAAYFTLKQDVAVINTKLEYIQRDVNEIKTDLRNATDP